MKSFAMSLVSAIAVASCAGNPADGLVFACDPDWQAAGAADPCLAGCRCERAPEGWTHPGVCACGTEGFDFGAGGGDATDDVQDAGDGAIGTDAADAPDDADARDDADAPDDADTAGDTGFEDLPDVCVPDCTLNECGDDGCGQPCGTCGDNETCMSGRCHPACWAGPCPTGFMKFDGCRCRVPPTGSKTCRMAEGLVACDTLSHGDAFFGQDAHFTIDSRAFSTVDTWIIADQNTGLVWSDEEMQPKAHDEALDQCAAMTPTSQGAKWRLPNVWELLSFTDYGADCPMWDMLFGTACIVPTQLWSSTVIDDASGATLDPAMVIDYSTGLVLPLSPDVYAGARCVQGDVVSVPVGWDRFVPRIGTVIDRVTGLEWQGLAEQQTLSWEAALATCIALGTGWHLPTVNEMFTLVPVSTDGCPVWQTVNRGGDDCEGMAVEFWTSTPMTREDNGVYCVDMLYGAVTRCGITDGGRGTRCVRFNG